MAHPSLHWFEFGQLPPHLQAVSAKFRDLAYELARTLPENEQSRQMMLDLLRAKDCAVRAAIAGATAPPASSSSG